jgi:eukaryotic-like serine/threonine-protein kinase
VKPDLEPGTLLGSTYRLVRRIGSGGMGEVYEATHERLSHRYAVKFLHPGVREHPEALSRFMREAQVTSRLRHPGIVSVVDFNTLPNGVAYLVMEYLEGESLGKFLARTGPLPLDRVVDITDQLSSALTAAHQQGVVHRDMHPQNVFVVPGIRGESERIKILDFGISKIASISQKITGTAAVIGTPQYMSPEQAEGKTDELDASSDQFSLAAIVYELLTGRPAFSGQTLASVAYQVVHAKPESIRKHRPELPAEMENVVSRGLAKNKKDRFPSVSEFAVHLRWTATLSGNESSRAAHPEQGTPTIIGFDADETTAVSALPSGMAAVLRESNSSLPAAPGSARKRRETDELTVVAPSGASFQNDSPAARAADGDGDPIAGTRRPRRLLIGAAVAGGALVVTVVVGVAARGRTPRSDVPIAPAGAGAAATGAAAAGAGGRSPAAAAQPPPSDPTPAAGRTAGSPEPSPEASEASEPSSKSSGAPEAAAGIEGGAERKWRGRPRSPEGASTKEAASAPEGGEKVGPAPGPGQCRITVGSYPWSDLWIDGRDTGQQTPVVDLPIACGPHRLQFKRRDLRIDQTENVTVSEGHAFKRQYDLHGSGVDD